MKFKLDKKNIVACVFAGSLALLPNSLNKGDAFYDGNKIVIEEYGVGKVEIDRDMFDKEMVIGDVSITMGDDEYDYYLDKAYKHEEEMPYYYLMTFGLLGGVSAGSIAVSKFLKRRC